MKKNFWGEFREFAMKGNVMDMAVGVIIGGAFGKIVSSLVADIIMPLLGLVIGGVNFADLAWTLKAAQVVDGVVTAPAVTLTYGKFLQSAFDFIIIAFSIFLFIKLIGNLSQKGVGIMAAAKKKVGWGGKDEPVSEPAPEAALEAAPAPAASEELLTQIRDLLKEIAEK